MKNQQTNSGFKPISQKQPVNKHKLVAQCCSKQSKIISGCHD
ncbi:MAG: hypothetical protein N2247_03340 [Leptospiraceae bacterium]|jgi:hypothetical protein|nr:hypothetical protein [Leptospiraceae bacterium]